MGKCIVHIKVKTYSEFIDKYLEMEKAHALKFMNIINKDENKVFDNTLKNSIDKSEYDLLVEEVKENKIEELKVKDLAKKSELTVLYDYIYTTLSNEVHTNVKSLYRYLKYDDNGLTINCLPQFENVQQIIFTIIIIMILAIDNVNKLFHVQDDEIGNTIIPKYVKLIEVYNGVNLFNIQNN